MCAGFKEAEPTGKAQERPDGKAFGGGVIKTAFEAEAVEPEAETLGHEPMVVFAGLGQMATRGRVNAVVIVEH